MKRTAIAFAGMIAAASAFAQPPAWFVLKHPEVKAMERMQAQEELASRASSSKQKLAALHDTSQHAMARQGENKSHGS